MKIHILLMCIAFSMMNRTSQASETAEAIKEVATTKVDVPPEPQKKSEDSSESLEIAPEAIFMHLCEEVWKKGNVEDEVYNTFEALFKKFLELNSSCKELQDKLKATTILDLKHASIKSIAPMASLSHLEWIDLSGNDIEDISPLKGMTSLTDLLLDWNKISDLSPLKDLKNLNYLSLNENKISDLSPLSNLTGMTNLLLESNQISDISPLKNLAECSWLKLDGNKITDISALAGLTELMVLELGDNPIKKSPDTCPVGEEVSQELKDFCEDSDK